MAIDVKPITDRLRETEERVVPFFELGPAELERSYGAGKWTIRQILAHLADCEMVNLWRFCRAAAESGSKVASFEENDWARNLDYSHRPTQVSRGLFVGARGALIHFVETLPADRLSSACVHPEKGELAAWRWARLAVNHCTHHLGQLEAARAGKPWVEVISDDSWEFGAAKKP